MHIHIKPVFNCKSPGFLQKLRYEKDLAIHYKNCPQKEQSGLYKMDQHNALYYLRVPVPGKLFSRMDELNYANSHP